MFNAIANIMDRRENLYRYVRSDLVPMLRSSGREELAAELEDTFLVYGPAHLRRLKPESIEQLKEVLRLEIKKTEMTVKKGELEARKASETKTYPMIELIGYLPEPGYVSLRESGKLTLAGALRRAFSRIS